MATIVLNAELRADRKIVLDVPDDVPLGPVLVVAEVETEEPIKPIRTGQDMIDSGFFGSMKDRDDLPSTNEEFVEWRRRMWYGDRT